MIKATYNPITGVRYIVVDIDPRTEEKRSALSLRAQSLYNRTQKTHANQMQRANNTKSK